MLCASLRPHRVTLNQVRHAAAPPVVLKLRFVLRGQFTDDIGEDFLGLRELGIAAKLGLSSLSVPKRLLKGKRNAKGPNATYGISFLATVSFLLTPYCHSAKTAEPPPPYPPSQPFVPLASDSVKNQIGLLRGYFEHRLAGLDSLPDDPQILLKRSSARLGR